MLETRSVLWLRHELTNADPFARFSQHELRAPGLIVFRQRFEEGTFDEALEPEVARGAAWSRARVVLEGEVLARVAGRDVVLRRGGMLACATWSMAPLRGLTATSDVLNVAWLSGGPLGARAPTGDVASLPGAVQAAMDDLARAIGGHERAALGGALRAVISALRALGIDLDEDAATGSAGAVEPADHRFADAIQAVLFPLSARPMAADLGHRLDRSDRHVLRLAQRYFERFHVTVSGWREYVHAMRIGVGMFLASHPRSRTEGVSRTLGFSSPTALCHAFHAAGLPSPQALRRELGAGR
ncbi:Hypothetical protein A7982_02200 [Minicystis rosea]|nr:Hypothetical protein A7982_02200 [Minicystis rosea]